MTIKLTQGELKRQRDALRQYERYLPNLQLKKQLLQLEIVHLQNARSEKEHSFQEKRREAEGWSSLLIEAPDIHRWLIPSEVITSRKNIAGVDLPVFEQAVFPRTEYDLFLTPLWVDTAIIALQEMIALKREMGMLEEGIITLQGELRVTTQRVNLFEKIKIPDAKEAIRQIKIYLGDQMTTAVCQSKIAKNKSKDPLPEEMAR